MRLAGRVAVLRAAPLEERAEVDGRVAMFRRLREGHFGNTRHTRTEPRFRYAAARAECGRHPPSTVWPTQVKVFGQNPCRAIQTCRAG